MATTKGKTKTKAETIKVKKRILTGIVVSDKMTNTVVVSVTTKKSHPIYKKVIKTWKKYKADVKGLDIKVGDNVMIQESRKLSHDKKWVVINKA